MSVVLVKRVNSKIHLQEIGFWSEWHASEQRNSRIHFSCFYRCEWPPVRLQVLIAPLTRCVWVFSSDQQTLFCWGYDLTIRVRRARLTLRDDLIRMCHCHHCHCHSSWKQLSLISDEEVISLSHAKVHVFSDSVLCLGKMNQNPESNTIWEEKLSWFKSSSQYRTLDTIDGEPMEFEWHIFQGFTTLQLCNKIPEFMSKMSDQPEQFKGRIIFMSMFNDISWDLKTMNRSANLTPTLLLSMQEDFQQEDGHSSDLDQKRSGLLLIIANHKESGKESLNWWW